MNIHEYQAKAVLRDFGVPTPRGHAAFTVEEAEKAAKELATAGRGSSRRKSMPAAAARPAASRWSSRSRTCARKPTRLLGSTLVTHQTGPQGKQVNRLYIEEGSMIDREFYLSALVDRDDLARRLRGLDRRRHGHRGSGA